MKSLFFGFLVVLALVLAYRSEGGVPAALPNVPEPGEIAVFTGNWEHVDD